MSSYDNHQALAGLTLGKSTDYRDTYDASLLQGVPRSLNRDPLGLHADNLPFHGADIWTLYELSRLNGKVCRRWLSATSSCPIPASIWWSRKALSSISTALTRPVSLAGRTLQRR